MVKLAQIVKYTLEAFIGLGLLMYAPYIGGLTFQIEEGSDIVGAMQKVTVVKGDTLHSIARQYDLGLLEMQEANPQINPDKKLAAGTELVVPSEFILPPGPREGIVINLAELRVYYYPPDSDIVVTHPVGVGRLGWRTPIGETTIIRKRENPTWVPPASIRAYSASKGIRLPAAVGPGPNNPLGKYAMNLGWNGYLMHGTNAPTSVGVRSSSGCIRMYPEDIENLYSYVSLGTPVRVIYEPFKIGTQDGQLYLEAHELFQENYYNVNNTDRYDLLQQSITNANYPDADNIDWDEAKELIRGTHGYPVNITNTIHEVSIPDTSPNS